MSSHITTANRGDGDFGLGQQRGQAAVAGDAHAELVVPGAVPALLEVQAAGLDVPEVRGDEPPVGQPVLVTLRSWRRSDAAGSCRTRVEVRPRNATGTGDEPVPA